ncbi:hypothetical protein Ahy_Scaffold2g107627 [Arachis hypogaea]|uniref:SWIM-type domain-containing protein n=1 Tax=Arachis hypogaea TaxID=3818 RepID=A0A444WQH2_ARAHY|nr:hypothetical protein Ahy_Scaffold2g107627 [Arachis hypogaea]
MFLVEELEHFEGWSQGSFLVCLTTGTCNCSLFQSLHFPCRHVLSTCVMPQVLNVVHTSIQCTWSRSYLRCMRRSFSRYQMRSFGRSGMGHGFILTLPCSGSLLVDLFSPDFIIRWKRVSSKRNDVVSASKSFIPEKVVQTG